MNIKVGLIRHFKVNISYPKKTWLNRSEVIDWFREYDLAGVESRHVELYGIDWDKCYSSSLSRAVTTARMIYKGEIVAVDALKELDILHQLPDRIKLPFMVWGLLVRMKSFSSNKDTDEFRNRIKTFVDELLLNSERNVLVVSHWFVMRILRDELIRRGLSGVGFKSTDYGTVYLYEGRK